VIEKCGCIKQVFICTFKIAGRTKKYFGIITKQSEVLMHLSGNYRIITPIEAR
jgi:hypothetical protein